MLVDPEGTVVVVERMDEEGRRGEIPNFRGEREKKNSNHLPAACRASFSNSK